MPFPISDNFTTIYDSDPRSWLQGPIIAANKDCDLEVWGTAFLIAEGWAMTAKHVIKDYLASIGGIDFSRGGSIKSNFSFLIRLTMTDTEGKPVSFAATQIYYAGTDIALLRVQIQDGKTWASLADFPTLQLLPPKVGESIAVVGCPHSYLNHTHDNVREVHLYPRLSTGVVRDVHEMSRDRNLNFPCFHMSARVLGRMSGSPIFNSKGYICGVAVYSMQQDETLEPISYGATLWPTAGIGCDKEPPVVGDSATFFDVMRRGQIKVTDLDQVIVAKYRGKRQVINLPIAAKAGWTPEGNVIAVRT